MEEVTRLTQEGKEKLEEELKHLKTVERPEVAKLIGEAKSFGDLSENSEYDAAKTREAQVEMRIREIEEKLKNVVIIDKDKIDISKVNMGCTVTIEVTDMLGRNEMSFEIRGEDECDPNNGIISDKSPLGEALMGRKEGERVEYLTPDGVFSCVILKISRI